MEAMVGSFEDEFRRRLRPWTLAIGGLYVLAIIIMLALLSG